MNIHFKITKYDKPFKCLGSDNMEVYFDNSATTKPYDEVIEAMVDTMKNYYGNPSSAHTLGLKAEQKMGESREILQKL